MSDYRAELWPDGLVLSMRVTGRWSCRCSDAEYDWLHAEIERSSLAADSHCIGAIPLEVSLADVSREYELMALAVWRHQPAKHAGPHVGPMMTDEHEAHADLGAVSNLTVEIVKLAGITERVRAIVDVCENMTATVIRAVVADGQIERHKST